MNITIWLFHTLVRGTAVAFSLSRDGDMSSFTRIDILELVPHICISTVSVLCICVQCGYFIFAFRFKAICETSHVSLF